DDNGDAPPKYSDDNQTGVGPYAELDVTPTGTGTCSITAAEDMRYLIDDSNPLDPKPRSASVSVTLQ
ncbi:MAG TPA: hypothetical protein VFE17_13400, partial [Candidatus Baltobacteraceae bacterium]|nr:hypothetical protein [Candidatus Baltobacteraceae bacterium]